MLILPYNRQIFLSFFIIEVHVTQDLRSTLIRDSMKEFEQKLLTLLLKGQLFDFSFRKASMLQSVSKYCGSWVKLGVNSYLFSEGGNMDESTP